MHTRGEVACDICMLRYIICGLNSNSKYVYTKLECEMRWECGAVLTASSPYSIMLALWGNAAARGKGNMDYLLAAVARPFCRCLHESPGGIGGYTR